jgi:hypothetical protein
METTPRQSMRNTTLLLAALLLAPLAALHAADAAKPSAKPNIVMSHCHDVGQFLHCYGVKTVHTPNLDKFAEQGVRFARSFCTQPGCSSSRASLFTGRYPHSNGVMGLTHGDFAWDLRPEEKHLAQFPKESGYITVAIGAIHETRSGAARCGYDKHINKAKVAEGTTAAIEELRRLATGRQPFYLYGGFIEPHRLPYPKDSGPMAGLIGFPGPHLQPDTSLGVDVPGEVGKLFSEFKHDRSTAICGFLWSSPQEVRQVILRWPESAAMPKPEDVVLRWSDAGVFHEAAQPGIIGNGRQWVYTIGEATRATVLNNLVLTVKTTKGNPDTLGIPEVEIPSNSSEANASTPAVRGEVDRQPKPPASSKDH